MENVKMFGNNIINKSIRSLAIDSAIYQEKIKNYKSGLDPSICMEDGIELVS